MKPKISSLLSSACMLAALGVAGLMPVSAVAEEKANAKPAAAAPQEAEKPKDYKILEVDGKAIKYSEVEKVWKGLFPDGQAPDLSRFDDKVRQNVLRGVISERVIYKKAMASGVENSPEVKDMLERLKQKLITQAFLEQQVDAKVTDADVRAEYDKRAKAKKGKQEVRARHILVKTEDEAKDIKKQLDDGTNFEKLAREKSTDKSSAVRGGDLGYFDENEMVPSFSKAAFALDKGDVSEPVKSDFGWHIIKMEDKRDAKMPPFEDMDGSIREELRTKALNKYIRDVVDSAKVKYYGPDGKELQLTKTPDSTQN